MKWPKYIRLQRQKVVLQTRLKVTNIPPSNSFNDDTMELPFELRENENRLFIPDSNHFHLILIPTLFSSSPP